MGRRITGPLEMIGGSGESEAVSAHELRAVEQERMGKFLMLAREPEVDDLPLPVNIQGIYDHTVQVAENRSAEIVQSAEDNAAQLIKNANEDGRSIVESAREDAEQVGSDIRKKATEDACEIRDEAEKTAREIGHQQGVEAGKIEGAELGHQEGWEQGYKEGWEQGHREYVEVTEQVRDFLQSIKAQKDEIFETAETDLIGLVFDIAEKVIHHQISNDQVTYYAVKSALDFAVGSQKLEIRVNPKDIKSLEPHHDEFHQLVSQGEQLEIVEDEEVDLGGCLLISDFGQLDSRLETKLSQVDQIVRPEN